MTSTEITPRPAHMALYAQPINHEVAVLSPNDAAWRYRHNQGVNNPLDIHEQIIVKLGLAIDTAVQHYGDDGFLRRYIAPLITGFRGLLNANLGRLDGGTLDQWAWHWASAIEFNLDTETFAS